MEINKELIKKYHTNKCSVAEKAFVEAWLVNDEFEQPLGLSKQEKEGHQKEIWQNLSSFIDKSEQKAIRINQLLYLSKIAAVFLLLLAFGVYGYQFLSGETEARHISFSNSSATKIKSVDSNSYSIAMAPNSNAEIDIETGVFNFYGSLLLSPKNDIEISFNGFKEKIKLKTGQRYIVISGKFSTEQPIVVNERDVLNLPPVIQRELSSQFSI